MSIKAKTNLKLYEVKNILSDLIANQLDILPQELEANKSFNSYGLDSLRAAQILNGIEVNFGFKFSCNF